MRLKEYDVALAAKAVPSVAVANAKIVSIELSARIVVFFVELFMPTYSVGA